MAAGNHKHHVVLQKRFYAQILAQLGPFNQGKLNLASNQRFEHGVCVAAAGGDVHFRVQCKILGDHLRQQILPDGLRRAYG